jgi:hypothetical protein
VPGYLVRLDPEELDLERFETLLEQVAPQLQQATRRTRATCYGRRSASGAVPRLADLV